MRKIKSLFAIVLSAVCCLMFLSGCGSEKRIRQRLYLKALT